MALKIMADNGIAIPTSSDGAMYDVFAGHQDFVIKNNGGELAITHSNTSFIITMASGECVICGRHVVNDNDLTLTLTQSDSGYIVLRYDLTQTGENICRLMAVNSTYSQNINNIDGSGTIHDIVLGQYTTNTSGVSSYIDLRSIKEYSVKVDNALNTTSENPVQNKVIKSAIDTINGLITAIQTTLGNKVDKISGKGLSTNDFTSTLLNKLNGIEAQANKYTLPTASSSVLGGIKVGSRLSISSGTLSANDMSSQVDILGTFATITGSANYTITNISSYKAIAVISNTSWGIIGTTSGMFVPTSLAKTLKFYGTMGDINFTCTNDTTLHNNTNNAWNYTVYVLGIK